MTDIDGLPTEWRDGCAEFWRVVERARGAVLASWFADARLAYFDAAELLGLSPADEAAVRAASPATVWLDSLSPAYAVLAHRVETELYRGDQPSLFGPDFETAVSGRWTFFACNLMREPGCSTRHRLVLQATVGLDGGLDRPAAARTLADAMADGPLPSRLWREPPCF